MKVIKPTVVTPSSIIASSLTESQQSWSSTVNYAVGATVVDGYDGVYEALTANINKKPSTNPLSWNLIGPSNSWALFDTQVSTASVGNNYIEITLATGALQAVALLNIIANLATVTVRDSFEGEIVYQSTQSLIGDVYDWYQYFFFDVDTRRNQAIFVDIPPLGYTDTYTTIRAEAVGPVSIGTCTFGSINTIGSSEYGVSTGITDYSIKETNEFGDTTFVRRAFSKRMSARVLVDNVSLNRIQRALYDLRAVPALWFASDDPKFEEALVVFGYYKDFSTDISYPTYSYCSLEIEGLI
jgi:hypothetical protein